MHLHCRVRANHAGETDVESEQFLACSTVSTIFCIKHQTPGTLSECDVKPIDESVKYTKIVTHDPPIHITPGDWEILCITSVVTGFEFDLMLEYVITFVANIIIIPC